MGVFVCAFTYANAGLLKVNISIWWYATLSAGQHMSRQHMLEG